MSLRLKIICENIFINTIIPKTIPKLRTKFVSGKILLENSPSLEFPKYLNKSKWASGKYLSHTPLTSPFRMIPTIKIIEVKKTDNVFDLHIKDKNIASDIKNNTLNASDKKYSNNIISGLISATTVELNTIRQGANVTPYETAPTTNDATNETISNNKANRKQDRYLPEKSLFLE